MTDPITNRFDAEFTLSGSWLPANPREDYFPGVDTPDCHQVETREALLSDKPNVILNTNPTGAGKTLSWAAPTIRSGENGEGWVVVATYPTNALVSDQLEVLRSLISQYYTDPPDSSDTEIQLLQTDEGSPEIQTAEGSFPLEERVLRVTGEDTLGKSTSDELTRVSDIAFDASAANLPTIILTTPDMLTLIASNRLSSHEPRGLLQGADAVVVDEFHLSNPRAKRHLPFYLDFYQTRLGNRTRLQNIVFLSATPEEAHVSQIQRGMDTTIVTRKTFSEEPRQPSRKILPEATLYTTTNPIFTNGRWISDYIEEVVQWIESGEEQSLVVVDSVREVDTVAAELNENTSLSVGKVYGWKREGRKDVVESSDIVVGNTAVEVGIDFEVVDRILTTGYTPNSAIQRLGRMRARKGLESCEIALITTKSGHDAILREETNGYLSRDDLNHALHEIGQAAETPYYGLLCALYYEYQWKDASNPLGDTMRKQDRPKYKQAIYDHFSEDAEPFDAATESPEAFWNDLREMRTSVYSSGTHPIFEEMHSYRSSSLSVTIIDETDPEEPLKENSLNYILRYGDGEFISQGEASKTHSDAISREATAEEDQKLQAFQQRTVGTFRLEGLRSSPADIGIEDFKQVTVWRNKCRTKGSEVACLPKLMSDPKMKRLSGGIRGSEYIDLGDEILAQYAHGDRSTVRSRFGLGPYANIYPVGESDVILLWQDAILAHAYLMNDHVETEP